MDHKHVVFDEEQSRWYRHTDSLSIKILPVGAPIPAKFSGIKAATYVEAFEVLYGTAFAF